MTNDEFMMKCTDCVNFRSFKTTYSTDRYWMQSICYVKSEDALVRCFTNLNTSGNNEISSIEKLNYSTKERISCVTNLKYGHVNDITYNPVTNKLYLTPMYCKNSTLDKNLIYVLNVSTFAKEREIHVGTDTNNCIYGITYDEINNRYYIAMSDNKIAVLNSSFEILSEFSLIQYGVNSYKNTFQCLEYYDGKLFLLYFEKIVVFDIEGRYLKNFSVGGSIESEGLALTKDGDFIIGKVYEDQKGRCISELLSFNILDCRDVTDLLSVEVGATAGVAISKEIKEKMNVNSNAKILNGINYVKRRGNLVQCTICITNITEVGSKVVALLPSGYTPSHYMRVIVACSGKNFARFEIATDGRILIYATSLTSISSSDWFELNVTYLVD